MRSLRLLPLLLVIVQLAVAARCGTLPPTAALLPIASFGLDNAPFIAVYNCNPTYTAAPCSGHGDCYLLLDTAANASLPFLNASTALPIPTTHSALDTYGIDSSTLPVAVCVCDGGWSGRGQFMNHLAVDGDSCHINRRAVTGVCITLILLYFMIFCVAINRLVWWVTVDSSGADAVQPPANPAAVLIAPVAVVTSQFSAVENSRVVSAQHASPSLPHVSMMHRQQSTASQTDAVTSPTSAAAAARTLSPANARSLATAQFRRQLADQLSPRARSLHADALFRDAKPGNSKRARLWRKVSHINFLIPLSASLLSMVAIVLFGLQASFDWTIGTSLLCSALMYVIQVLFYIASCLGAYSTQKLAASITRRQPAAVVGVSLATLLKRQRFSFRVHAVLHAVLWLIVFRWPSSNSSLQQSAAIYFLFALHAPLWSLSLQSMYGSWRIITVLRNNLELLAEAQREMRLTLSAKLRSQASMLGVFVTATVVLSVVLACSGSLRQTGVPFYSYGIFFVFCNSLTMRLVLLRPKSPPAPAAPSTPLPVDKLSRVAARNVLVSTTTSPGQPMHTTAVRTLPLAISSLSLPNQTLSEEQMPPGSSEPAVPFKPADICVVGEDRVLREMVKRSGKRQDTGDEDGTAPDDSSVAGDRAASPLSAVS